MYTTIFGYSTSRMGERFVLRIVIKNNESAHHCGRSCVRNIEERYRRKGILQGEFGKKFAMHGHCCDRAVPMCLSRQAITSPQKNAPKNDEMKVAS